MTWLIRLYDDNLGEKVYDPFLWIGFICLKAAKPLWGESLLLTFDSQEFLYLFDRPEEWKNFTAWKVSKYEVFSGHFSRSAWSQQWF